jgi:hypothetical protein
MKNIKVNKVRLLQILRTNRDQHIQDYLDAMTEYRKAAIIELTDMLEFAKTHQVIRRTITHPEPKNFETSYNTAIGMLELSIDNDVELTSEEFSRYVEDKWDWHSLFTSSTLLYKKE